MNIILTFLEKIRWIILFILLSITVVSLIHYDAVLSIIDFDLYNTYILISIVLFFILFWYLGLLKWIETVRHELSHVIVAVLFFRKITSIKLNFSEEDSGHIDHTGKSFFLINLAPYFLPIWTIIFILLSYIVNDSFLLYINYLIIFLFLNYITAIITSLLKKPSDISRTGFFFSYIFILAFNLNIIILFIYFIFDKLNVYLDLYRNNFDFIIDYITHIFM